MMKKILCLTGALLFLSTLGFAWVRASADYRTSLDAVTGGGGRSASASYVATQQAVGQTAGFSTSASYQDRAGVVQPIPGFRGSVFGWMLH